MLFQRNIFMKCVCNKWITNKMLSTCGVCRWEWNIRLYMQKIFIFIFWQCVTKICHTQSVVQKINYTGWKYKQKLTHFTLPGILLKQTLHNILTNLPNISSAVRVLYRQKSQVLLVWASSLSTYSRVSSLSLGAGRLERRRLKTVCSRL